jgi:MFS transporter, DHA1 family, multidrug resistance protein
VEQQPTDEDSTEGGSSLAGFRRAAALASGPAEVIDFLLPLWAASDLDASPAAIGAVVAVEAIVSLIVRPAAGVLTDRHEGRLAAGAGAALSALAFAVYATAPNIGVVAAGAALGGAGGALFWVALRADVGSHLDEDPAAYARLLSSEQLGSLLAFVIALSLLGAIGYRPLFWLGAGAYLAALGVVVRGRPEERPRAAELDRPAGLRAVGAALAPFLALTALTAGVESGLALLLILYLQAAFHLDPREIALLFFPGAVLLVVLPEPAFEFATRLGRTRSLMLSLIAGAAFAALLALVGSPLVVALMWTLCAACLATAVPVEQSTVARASLGSLGRGTSLYEAAVLLGIIIMAPALAAVYGGLGWSTACVVIACGLVAGAALVPLALRALGLPDDLAAVSPAAPSEPQ